MSPFEIGSGRKSMTPSDVAKTKSQEKCPVAYKVARDRHEMISKAQDCLRKAHQLMKKMRQIPKYDGPFEVVEQVNDDDDPNKKRSKRAPPSLPMQFDAAIQEKGRSKKNTKDRILSSLEGQGYDKNVIWVKAKNYLNKSIEFKKWIDSIGYNPSLTKQHVS
ncbi:hypothetical protein KY290_013074 [Solanum tuberosum]|uniref:Uncharacterized protein n=1 Tax=Solanum tuberosum TaxID=4113 RepID=A0ABQ7VMK7_SOLTU|nr:hypothetical protein KY285_012849 [Solanum tuberosum]KAH0769093.1 hypothetical protein KY290_013074 [Solanum tuberosum]